MPSAPYDPSIQGQAQTARFQHATTVIGEMEGALLQASDIIAAHQQNAGLVTAQADALAKSAVAQQTRAAAAAAATAQVMKADALNADDIDALGRRLLAELQRPLEALSREVGSGHQNVMSLAQSQEDLAARFKQLAQETKVAQAEAAHRAAEAAHAAALRSEKKQSKQMAEEKAKEEEDEDVYGIVDDTLLDDDEEDGADGGGGGGDGADSGPRTISIFDSDSDSDSDSDNGAAASGGGGGGTADEMKAAAQAAAFALATKANEAGSAGTGTGAGADAARDGARGGARWLPPPENLAMALQGTLALVKSQSRQIRELEVKALLRAQAQHYTAESATATKVQAAAAHALGGEPLLKVNSIQLVASKASRHLKLQAGTPSFALTVTASGVSLEEDGGSGKQLIWWPFSLISRYGLMGGMVSMETRGSSRGVPGVFHFGAGNNAAGLYRKLKACDELSVKQR